jgi:flagellar motor protein MotB
MGKAMAACMAGLVLAALGLGGCGNPLKDENAALKQENAELRSQLEAKDAALGDLEGRLTAADSEAKRLASEGASKPAGGGGGATGFEGVDGINVERGRSQISVGVAGDVLFDSGSATLKSGAKSTLDKVAGVIKSRYASNKIRIEGHTDSDPLKKTKEKWKSNERLSAERALAVEEYLASRGVAKKQMYVAGYGPDEPKGSKKTSRRVEIVILQ